MLEREQGGNRVECPGSSIAVAKHGTWNADRKGRKVTAEDNLERLGLTLIRRRDGLPIKAEVPDILGLESRFLHHELYRTSILAAIG